MSFSESHNPQQGPMYGQGAYGANAAYPPPQAGWPPTGPPPHAMPGPPPPQSPPPKPESKGDVEGLAMLAVIVLLHVVANIYWLSADNHLIHLDEAHHGKCSAAFSEALFPGDDTVLFERGMRILTVESPYPPLSQLLGAAFIRLLGDVRGPAYAGSLALALLLLGVYVLARQGTNGRNAFLIAFVAGFIPMVFGYARYGMPDTLLGTIIVWALVALLKADGFRNPGWSAVFGVLFGLALLTKQMAFVYLALPILAFLCMGLLRALRSKDRAKGKNVTRIAVNGVVCGFIVLGVCSWWYLRNVEYLHAWWGTQRGGESGLFQPAVASCMDSAMAGIADAPGIHISFDPAISRAPTAIGERTPHEHASFLEPYRRQWSHYLLFLVNEVAFLPLTLLALAGLPALCLKKNRTPLALLLVAWPVGSYLLLTGLFAIHSPRFLYCMAPALAFPVVLGLDAIPRKRLYRAAWCLLVFILLFQYVNLTFFSYAPLHRLEIPIAREHPVVAERGNRGLTVYKDVIRAGNYTIQAPMRGKTTAEIILDRMADYERRRTDPAGPVAWYQVTSPTPARLGLDYYARLYLSSSTDVRSGVEATNETRRSPRPFVAIKWESPTPEGTLPELAETEYAILKETMEAGYIDRLEEGVVFFKSQGFKSILHHHFPGYGPASQGYVHVLAHQEAPQLTEAHTVFDLYDLLERDGVHYLLSDEDRREAERRYTVLIENQAQPEPLSRTVNLLGFHVEKSTDDWYTIRLIVHAQTKIEEEYDVWIRATPHDEDRAALFDAQQGQSEINWDFAPQPSSTQWGSAQALVLSRPVMAKPLRYQFEIGLKKAGENEKPPIIVESEWVDFASATEGP